MALTGSTNKYYRLILNLVTVILVLIIANNIYKKQTRAVNLLRQAKESEIKKAAIINDIGQLEKALDSHRTLLNKKDTSSVINTISDIAKESDVKIALIKPERQEDYTAYIKYPFSLSINTDKYHSIGKFISRLENYKGIYIIIETMNIKLLTARAAQETPVSKSKLNADLTLIAVSVKD